MYIHSWKPACSDNIVFITQYDSYYKTILNVFVHFGLKFRVV